jgi:hypothetical protein
VEAKIFTEDPDHTIRFFIDEPSPRLIAIDSLGVLRGRWTMDSVQKGSSDSEPASHSKHGHKGREESRQMRQHHRGTAGAGSESGFSVYKRVFIKPSPLTRNVISKCFTHNSELESESLVHSGRPTNGLHLKDTKIRCKWSV